LSPGSNFSNLMRPRVRLREATTADARLLELWQGPGYRGEFNDFGLPSRPVGSAIRERGLIDEDRGALIVEVAQDGRPIGSVSWHAVHYGPNPQSRSWNIGIALVPEARGHGYGGEAQRLLADRLFATTTANRIDAMTDVENTAEQRALEKAGFVREGVLRGAQFRAGGWHDLVVYSLVRPAPPTI
jgi:RimJ/RimL family protein N-acetyltransferase